MTLVPEPDTVMPGGGVPSKVSTSSACGLVSVIVAEARLGLSLSMIKTSISTMATGDAALRKPGEIVCAGRGRVVRVEVEHRRDVRRRDHDMHVHRRGIAVEAPVVDRYLDAAVGGGGRGERAAVDHLAQRGLIVGERRRAAERDFAVERVVARCRDAGRQRAGDGEHVARVQAVSEYVDRRRLDRRVVIGDQDVDVGDRDRRPAGRVCRRGVRSETTGIVGVEVEGWRSADQARHDMDERLRVVTP